MFWDKSKLVVFLLFFVLSQVSLVFHSHCRRGVVFAWRPPVDYYRWDWHSDYYRWVEAGLALPSAGPLVLPPRAF